ncbi:hypothetical protein DK880_00068 [Candidatus Cardinium hertigii]|uniref:Uncharacterized protein n=2 Tax=Candidatus Cardinium hertigii TaxID=247481 RepID=A0A2Z3LBT8_9BACT|nr:hypothetical protein DK880_00068 [Candidatus Cardinium hertigii]
MSSLIKELYRRVIEILNFKRNIIPLLFCSTVMLAENCDEASTSNKQKKKLQPTAKAGNMAAENCDEASANKQQKKLQPTAKAGNMAAENCDEASANKQQKKLQPTAKAGNMAAENCDEASANKQQKKPKPTAKAIAEEKLEKIKRIAEEARKEAEAKKESGEKAMEILKKIVYAENQEKAVEQMEKEYKEGNYITCIELYNLVCGTYGLIP